MVNLALCGFPFATFGRSGLCGAPFPWARCWTKGHQTYLLDISVKLVHTQMFPPPPPFFFFPPLFFFGDLFFFFLFLCMIRHYQNTILGPLDLISLTQVKPEGQLCSGVCIKCCFVCFLSLYFVCKPNVNYVLY